MKSSANLLLEAVSEVLREGKKATPEQTKAKKDFFRAVERRLQEPFMWPDDDVEDDWLEGVTVADSSDPSEWGDYHITKGAIRDMYKGNVVYKLNAKEKELFAKADISRNS